jgi:hypothetical protein
VKIFFKYATSKACLYRAIKIALIVGTILNLLNHHDLFSGDTIKTKKILQMMLTYFVPFCVSTYSSSMQARYQELQQARRRDPGKESQV